MSTISFVRPSEEVLTSLRELSYRGDLDDVRKSAEMSDEEFLETMRQLMLPVKLKISRIGSERRISDTQHRRVTDLFEAEVDRLRVVKRLYNFGTSRWDAVRRIMSEINRYFYGTTMDYPADKGIRLLRRYRLSEFTQRMDELITQFDNAVLVLSEQLSEIVQEAEAELKEVFDLSQYPASPELFAQAFSITYSFPSIEAAAELKTLDPERWQSECMRVRHELEESMDSHRRRYLFALNEALVHLTDKLTPDIDENGVITRKRFRKDSIDKLQAIIEAYKALSPTNGSDIAQVSAMVDDLLASADVTVLRTDADYAGQVVESLKRITELSKSMILETEVKSADRINATRRIGLNNIYVEKDKSSD